MKIVINYYEDEVTIKQFIETYIKKILKGHRIKSKETKDGKKPGMNHLYITVCKEPKK